MHDRAALAKLRQAAACALEDPYWRRSPLAHAMARGAAALQLLGELGIDTDNPEQGPALAQLARYWEFEPG